MMPFNAPQNLPRFDIVQFGNLMKRQFSIETGEHRTACATPILNHQEVSLISECLLDGNFDIAAAYRERLQLGRGFYFGVRQHLMAVLQVWDAVIDAKDAFDRLESLTWNRHFMEAFLLCTDTIPSRVNIGSLGPPGLPNNAQGLGILPTSLNEPLSHDSNSEHYRHEMLSGTRQDNGIETLQHHGAEAFALSDPDLGDTTTDEEEEDDEDDEDDEDEDDDTYEDVEPPIRPSEEPTSQVLSQNQTPFFDGVSEEWDTQLQLLVNDTRKALESEVSDIDDSTTLKDKHILNLEDTIEWNDSEAFDIVDMGTQPVTGRKRRFEPQTSVVPKMRRKMSEWGGGDEENRPSKRQKRGGKGA